MSGGASDDEQREIEQLGGEPLAGSGLEDDVQSFVPVDDDADDVCSFGEEA